MFKEEKVREHAEAVPAQGKASSSEQPMEVDDEGKKAVSEPVAAVNATKVTEEKEGEDTEGEDVMGTRRSRRGADGDEWEVLLWADVGGEETL